MSDDAAETRSRRLTALEESQRRLEHDMADQHQVTEEILAWIERLPALEEKLSGLESAVFMGYNDTRPQCAYCEERAAPGDDLCKTCRPLVDAGERDAGTGFESDCHHNRRISDQPPHDVAKHYEPDTFDFATTVDHLRAGRKVRRIAWHTKDSVHIDKNDLQGCIVWGETMLDDGTAWPSWGIEDFDATDWQLVEDDA